MYFSIKKKRRIPLIFDLLHVVQADRHLLKVAYSYSKSAQPGCHLRSSGVPLHFEALENKMAIIAIFYVTRYMCSFFSNYIFVEKIHFLEF